MDEYIDKHDAYLLLKDLEAAYIYPPVKEAYGTAARHIDQMPAADVQPVKHGRWIDRTVWFGRVGKCQYECSECGYMREGKPQSRYDGKGGKFCDECGAMMSKLHGGDY